MLSVKGQYDISIVGVKSMYIAPPPVPALFPVNGVYEISTSRAHDGVQLPSMIYIAPPPYGLARLFVNWVLLTRIDVVPPAGVTTIAAPTSAASPL
jgi:hypothetical protein